MRTHEKKAENFLYQIMLMTIGFLLIILAKFLEDITHILYLGNIASSIGGVFLGIGVSSIIQLVRMRDYHDSVFEKIKAEVLLTGQAIKETQSSVEHTKESILKFEDRARTVLTKYASTEFKSKEIYIRRFKSKYHGYYQSRHKDHGIIWQYHELDFSSSITPGVLECPISIIRPRGKKEMIYDQKAYRIDENSPLVINAYNRHSSSELTSVSIFPFVKNTSDMYFGIQLHEDWDEDYLVSPYIISEDPLPYIKDIGLITDKSQIDQLLSEWKGSIDKRFIMDLPELSTST